jgi:hypothetical protein
MNNDQFPPSLPPSYKLLGSGTLLREKDALISELEDRVARAEAAFNSASASLEEREDREGMEGSSQRRPDAGPPLATGGVDAPPH